MHQRRRGSAPTSIYRRERTRDVSNFVSSRTNRNIRENFANFRSASLSSSNFANRRAPSRDITLAQSCAIRLSRTVISFLLKSLSRCSFHVTDLFVHIFIHDEIQSRRTKLHFARVIHETRHVCFSHIVILMKKIPALPFFEFYKRHKKD